ncbi:MAG: DUF6541 family protein, partial [Anaerolineae bacterium]
MIDLIILLASIGIFILPGYALVLLLVPRRAFDQASLLCMATGASLAVFPLLLFFLTLLGIRSSLWTVLMVIVLSIGVIIGIAFRRSRNPSAHIQSQHTVPLEEILLLVVFFITLALRILVVRGENYPAGGDGYHHTLISQIIRDTGFIPENYRPYAPLDRFTYHFGFHSIVAAWVWITGLPTPKATLLVAQIINALSVPTMYIFARSLSGRKDIGLFAAMVVGLVTVMPAYYVNWSRDTQLTANVILPVALTTVVQVLEAKEQHWRWSVLASILLAGLFLAHYAIWLFAAVFVIVYVVAWTYANRCMWRRLGWLVGCGIGGSLLVSPWMLHFVTGYFLPRHIQTLVTSLLTASERKQIAVAFFTPVSWEWFFGYVLRPIQALLAYLGTLIGISASPIHRRFVLILMVWFGILFLLSTPSWTGLPYATALYNNFAVAIALYFAAAPLIALPFSYAAERIGALWPIARPLFLVVIVALACGMAVTWQPRLLNPDQAFVTPADEQAARWISDHIPADAKFAIRLSFTSPIEMAGIDGGYWLPYLTGRQVSVPPMIYYAEGDPEYLKKVFAFLRAWRRMENLSDFIAILNAYDISYVYI